MPVLKYTNNASTTLNGGITNVATSIVLTSGTLFPSLSAGDYFWGTLSDTATGNTIEIVKVTARSGNTITVVRGQEGTTASSFLNLDKFSLRVTAAGLNNMAKLDEDNVFTGTNTIPGYAASGANADITSLSNISTGTIAASGDITVPDEAYASGWNGSTEVPTKNAVYDKIESILDGQTFTGDVIVPDEAYGAGWNGDLSVPTKNAVYDQLESLTAVPAGTIIDFAGASAPSGYLECPLVATNISRTTYATLFTAIGTLWGAGDGSTTFGMPYFPQDYAGIHTTGTTGVSSTGTVKAHTHTYSTLGSGVTTISGGLGSEAFVTANTGSTGGAGNLAAGMRIRKCVKT